MARRVGATPFPIDSDHGFLDDTARLSPGALILIRHRRRALRPDLDILDDRCLMTILAPVQVVHAYGLDAVTVGINGTVVQGDGAGQTIAVVVAYHDPYLANDLNAFDSAFGLATPSLSQVNLAGGATDDGWAGEETLDVEWAHAIAPGARIIAVEAASTNLSDMLNAINVARNIPGVSVVSMSWGLPEFSSETSLDPYFTTPAGHTGITFVTASGDSGTRAGAEWPASSANVLGVGGTTLYLDATSNNIGEAVWHGSQGGLSSYTAEPSYQAGVQSTGRRSSPDVAFDGDPNTGVIVYTTTPSNGQGTWSQVGGTSLGSPAWAGIIAIADEARATIGLTSLDGPSQTLPILYALPASDFHKVGSRTSTGLGTPNGPAFVYGLAYNATTITPKTITGTPTPTTPITTTPGNGGRGRRGRRFDEPAIVTRTANVPTTRPAQAASVHDATLEALSRGYRKKA